ncbi:MAG: hypothetical protein KAH04_03400 [Psychrilyobacter sp.]|nr:hypothetical protein [Psychrilyobacter sp.]
MKKNRILLIFIFLIFVGCAPTKEMVLKSTPYRAPTRLAVLPINNNTNDVAGGFVFREILYNHFDENNLGYKIQNAEKTDRLLNEAGITDGGQLQFMRPIEVCEILGVDGLLYTNLDELNLMTYPYYHNRSIKATFLVYNFEKLIWVNPMRVAVKYYGISSAINTISGAISGDDDQLNKGLTQAGVDVAIHQGIKFATIAGLKHELAPEMSILGRDLLSIMPRGNYSNRDYVKESDTEIKLLKEKISKKQSIVSDEMYIEKKEEKDVIENIIPIIN